MTARLPHLAVLLLLAGQALAAPCGSPQDPAALGIDLSQQADCDPLVPERCMLPFPNDYFTVRDASTRTRRRVNFTPEGLPKNNAGTRSTPTELNRADGFSPGAALLIVDADGRPRALGRAAAHRHRTLARGRFADRHRRRARRASAGRCGPSST